MLDQRAIQGHYGLARINRAPLDPSMRRMIFGPVRPMERPGLLRRLLGG
jgi:hypothetical protein